MELQIGPYILRRRTEFSKYHLFDANTNKDITTGNEQILKKIIEDYEKQKANPSFYFSIADDTLTAFSRSRAKELDYIFVPEDITLIEPGVFSKGTFKEISLPSSLKTIPDGAFYNCKYLESIDIPDGVYEIGVKAFAGCGSLANVKLPHGIHELRMGTFKRCHWIREITLPENITLIGVEAFSGCLRLEKVNFPKNLKTIESSAFRMCFGFTELTIPDTVSFLGNRCFMECKRLKKVNLPDKIKRLCAKTFESCQALQKIKLPANLTSMEKSVFNGCVELESLTLPNTISSLGYGLFNNTPKLTTINIPNELEAVSRGVFNGSNIKTVIINDNLKSLGDVISDDYCDNEELSTNDLDLFCGCPIDKLVIDGNVSSIASDLLRYSGRQIEAIDYHGTKEQFEEFKQKNKDLFDKFLANVEDINFVEKDKNIDIEEIQDESR